jgi:hypothetical protein
MKLLGWLEKDMADKIPISDIKIGHRFKVESSNQTPRMKGDEILARWFL